MTSSQEWQAAEPGVRRRIDKIGDTIMNMIVEFDENAEGYQHSHPHEQLTYILYGEVEFTIDGKVQRLRAGESIYVPGNARHGVRALKASSLLDTFTPLRQDLLNP